MEIRELAERVLFGTRLEDKLVQVGSLSDDCPGPVVLAPAEPHRPPGLTLVRRARVGFPALAHLHRAEARGQALHHFAHHELLAMELMALALLRFPDAPPAFRRGLAGALAEEQAHFGLYHARMATCGVELGALPASALFWDALRAMEHPLDFVMGMSLTFEQANLDYSAYYQRAFATVGDIETARVLERVYEDEIGHVKLGLVWFRRWAPPADDEWTAYTQALPPTLQPSRAKGLEFDHEARRRAGFTAHYIQQLQMFTRSKGRVPALHSFDPAAEIILAGQPVPPVARQLQRDLETLPMFIAAGDDAVHVSRPPRPEFLAPLVAAGFTLPEFVTDADLTDRRFSALRPWADLEGTPAHLFNKGWAAQLLRNLSKEGLFFDEALIGVACTDVPSAVARINQLVAAGYAVVCKAAFGTAGRGLVRVGAEPPTRWLERTLRATGAVNAVVVEPWLDRVLDLGIQLTVSDERVVVDGITRNLVDSRGHHRGVALGKRAAGLPEDLRRWFMSTPVQDTLVETGRRVGEALQAEGHRGFAGIDALVYRGPDGYALKPIVEVNPRTTMGRVALGLQRRIAPGVLAAWVQVAADVGWVPHLQTRGTPPQILDGVVYTTDPVGARFATVLVVADSLETLRSRLVGVGAVDPLVGGG